MRLGAATSEDERERLIPLGVVCTRDSEGSDAVGDTLFDLDDAPLLLVEGTIGATIASLPAAAVVGALKLLLEVEAA